MYIYIYIYLFQKDWHPNIKKLDDGKILTGNPIKFDGKNQKVPV